MPSKILLPLAFCMLAQAADPPAARWEGTLHVPGRELPLVVDLDRDGAGQWIGSAILPGLSVKGAALKDISVKGSEIAFAIPAALGGVTLQGQVDGNGAFTGDFHQGGNTARFALRKVGPAQVEAPKRSTAVRSELEGEWQGDMNLGGRSLHVWLKLTNKDGKALAEVRVKGKADRTFPFDLVTEDGEFLNVDSTETGLRYEGRFRKESNEIKGTFSQGPMETELILKRAPAEEKAR